MELPQLMKKLESLTQFVIQSKEKRLNIKPTKDVWDIEAYINSDFNGDKDERKKH
jgi:hypothetical protein